MGNKRNSEDHGIIYNHMHFGSLARLGVFDKRDYKATRILFLVTLLWRMHSLFVVQLIVEIVSADALTFAFKDSMNFAFHTSLLHDTSL